MQIAIWEIISSLAMSTLIKQDKPNNKGLAAEWNITTIINQQLIRGG